MKRSRQLIQYLTIVVVHAITLILLASWLDGLQIQSLTAAIWSAIAFELFQLIYWWLFVNNFSRLPVWLYPLMTLLLTGGMTMTVGNLIPGVVIASQSTGIWITLVLTAVSTILSNLLSLNIESKFDSNVTQRLVQRRGVVNKTHVPGLLFLEIDGLGEEIFRRALQAGRMPTLKRWLDEGTHRIIGWETDFTSQTGAMQSGILFGSNEEVPAYRWWDRKQGLIVSSGNPFDSLAIEQRLSNGQGLLSGGGASRGNMFSGDATESLFTLGTLLDPKRDRGPGFYLYLLNPFLFARLVALFLLEVVKEWWQALLQRWRKDRHIVAARNFLYAFFRALVGPILQEITTFLVISDVLRGVPAIYALYAGYDDLAHFAGMDTPEAFGMLEEIDRYFARVERALQNGPRPYHVMVLSDHGQSTGPTFKAAHGLSLEQLVKGLTGGNHRVYASLNTNEAWDKINAVLNESISADTRTAHILRRMLRSKTRLGLVTVGPDRNPREAQQEQAKAREAQIIVMASGCAGLIYLTPSDHRVAYEEIQNRYPELILGLVQHPGIGFVLVRSTEHGDMVLGKEGVYFLDHDTHEGKNPLAVYGPNAPEHLKRESSFSACPDLVVNTTFDPTTGEICGFEDQVSHHGGLGGPQNQAFIFYPSILPYDGQPVIGATKVFQLLRGWRDTLQY